MKYMDLGGHGSLRITGVGIMLNVPVGIDWLLRVSHE